MHVEKINKITYFGENLLIFNLNVIKLPKQKCRKAHVACSASITKREHYTIPNGPNASLPQITILENVANVVVIPH